MLTRLGRRSFSFTGSVAALGLIAGWSRAEVVRAEDHPAVWLWAGVKPQPVLDIAREIYILSGEVRDAENPHVVSQRAATPRLKSKDIWIVYRAQIINWTEQVFRVIEAEMAEWMAAGNQLVGLQIDFDAGTKNLENYAAFLSDVRQRLPASLRLSITGLLDWSANGDPDGLSALADVVDEVVLQIYQGRKVIPGYQTYMRKLGRLNIPFKIGLLQGGDWLAPEGLEDKSFFRGYVVFLLNPE
jgi:hypothetical protein